MSGDSSVPSPWRRCLPGVVAGFALIVVGIGLGILVGRGYFTISGLGLAIAMASLLVALIRLTRPALRPPKNARTRYHWTTFYLRRLGEPGSPRPKQARADGRPR